jgi:hypothetical protein
MLNVPGDHSPSEFLRNVRLISETMIAGCEKGTGKARIISRPFKERESFLYFQASGMHFDGFFLFQTHNPSLSRLGMTIDRGACMETDALIAS